MLGRCIQAGNLFVPLDDFLLQYVFELHEQGMVATRQIVSRNAPDFCGLFHPKSHGAKSLIVYRWLKTQGLRYWMGTHQYQCFPAEAASDAPNFMQEIKKVSETNCGKKHYQYG